MQRRDVLRRSSVAATTLFAAGLAGCSGGGDGDSDGGGDGGDGDSDGGGDGGDEGASDPTPEPTPTPTPAAPEPTGELVESSVSGLEITDWMTTTTDEDLQLTLTVENVGDQQTDAFEYTYEATAYDSAGEDITTGVATGSTGSTIAPGQTAEVNMYVGSYGGPSEIDRFELVVRCDGFFDEGVYCGSDS